MEGRAEGLHRWEKLALVGVALVSVAAGVLHIGDAPTLLAFSVATLALAGLAWTVSFATEQIGERFGSAMTGFLQSTLGNLPEFFVVLFALSAGEVVVAQYSIIGSILANALLVLGLAIVAGSVRTNDKVMRFERGLPNDTAILLMITSFIVVLVGLSVQLNDKASAHVNEISIVGAICMLVVYATWAYAYLRNDQQPEHGTPRVSLLTGIIVLTAAGVGAAFVSEWFVAELRPSIDKLGISAAFAGLVIVAIAGNAVENVVGVYLAWKRQSDLAISVIKNSIAQVAVFLFPLLILCSLFFDDMLNFSLPAFLIGALLLSAIAVWQITYDGESRLFEGVALIALYVILATLTLYE